MHIKCYIRRILELEDEIYAETSLDGVSPDDLTKQEWVDMIYDKMTGREIEEKRCH